METGLLFCYSCLWMPLPMWMKALLGGFILIASCLGLWLLAAASGAGILACAASGGREAYEALDVFFDWDTMRINTAEHERTGGLVSPLPAVVEEALGLESPAGERPGESLKQERKT